MAKNSLGRIGFVFKGDYNNNTIYAPMDVVYYEGSSYICIKETINNLPNNTEYWHIFSKQADTKNIEKKLEFLESEFDINTVSGTSIHITDSAAAPMKISPRGNDIVQDTREGHNLFNVNDTNTVSSGITVDEEDWITITCDNSSGTSIIYQNYFTNNLNLKENTNYNIIAEIKKVSGTGNIQIVSSSSASQFNQSMGYLFSDLSNGQTVQLNKLTKSDFTNTTQGIRTFCSFNAGESGSITFRISVLEDITITSDDFVYKKFVASPSINYPSEVEYVGGNYDIEVGNKNMLDISKGTSTSTSYYLDNKVIINGGTYSNFLCPTIVITETDYYVFSFTAKVTSGNINFSILKNGTQIADTSVTENKNYSYKFEFDKGDNILIRLRSANNGVGEFSQIQLEQGSTATGYIEHQEQNYPLDLTNHPLYSEKDYIYKKDNKWYVHNEFDKVNAKDLSWSMNKVGLEGINYKQFYAKTTFEPQTFLPDNIGKIFSNTFKTSSTSNNKGNYMYIGNTGLLVCVAPKNANGEYITTLEDFKTAIKDTYFVGKLATPTETEITDEILIAQLEALLNSQSYKGVTNINSEAPTISVAELNLDVSYYISNAIRINNLEKAILSLGGNV